MLELSGLFPTNALDPVRAIPLLGVDVHAVITGAAAEVTLRQRFRNSGPTPIEAVYVFPLPTDAAINGFTAERGGFRIEGRIEAREKAFEAYDEAIAQGHGAFLVDQERPNIFTVSVGNLPPGQELALELRWVAPLDREGSALHFMLPTTVSPRYVASSESTNEVGEPDAERINPPHLDAVPYGLRFTADILSAALSVESPTHTLRTTLPTADKPMRLGLTQDAVAMDRDLVIILTPSAEVPALAVGRRGDARYVELAFTPTPDTSAGVDVVFMVDCSGSMQGTSIEEAARALRLCVAALDDRDTFDIVRFGSTAASLFGRPTPFNAASFKAATAYIDRLDADLGGTELLKPVTQAVQAAGTRQRQMILLTDGQVSNEAAVIKVVEEHRAKARLFTFGIGAGVSEHLVKELARVSGGRCELIAPGERIEPKVLRQFGRLRTPLMDDVRVDWGPLVVEQAPAAVPPIFADEPVILRGRVLAGAPSGEVALVAGGRRYPVPLTANDLELAAQTGPLPVMWARDRLRDLEHGTGRRGSAQARARSEDRAHEALLALALEYGLMSSLTSFVAVELRADADKTFNPALTKVPVALTAGWGGAGRREHALPQVRAARRAAPAFHMHSSDQLPRARRAEAAADAPWESASGGIGGALRKLGRALLPGSRSHGRAMAGEGADSLPRLARSGGPSDFARPAAPPAPAPAPAPSDPLYEVLMTQGYDGAFPLRALELLKVDLGRLAGLIAQAGAEVVYTAVVLHLLERDHRPRVDEWRASAQKARRFLDPFPPLDVAALL